MKKYHQLLLLAISFVSLTLFLIYRHEYNRLHYVLEVFNFFGQPCTLLNVSDILSHHHDWGPIPVWQEHAPGAYIYSAFLQEPQPQRNHHTRIINEELMVRAIALTTLSSDDENQLSRLNCYFWFDDDDNQNKPVIGTFRYNKITTADGGLFYLCSGGLNARSLPYAVSFSNFSSFKVVRGIKENDLKKIMLVSNDRSTINNNNSTISNDVVICVSPSSLYSKRRLIEFISYHKLLGIDTFIFYNRDIPHKFTKLIANLSIQLGLHIDFYSWNYPKIETSQIITRSIIENDCLLRTRGASATQNPRYVTTLELNEYIVPTKRIDNGVVTESMDRFSLPVQKFCVVQSERTRPISMQNLNAVDDYTYNVVRYVHKYDGGQVTAMDKLFDHASIHKYVRCGVDAGDSMKTHIDKSILRFQTDLIRSTLVQLFLHDQI